MTQVKYGPSYTASGRPDWALIPENMHGAMRRYIEQGLAPGDFLGAVLRNDLCGAVHRADDVNIHRIVDYVRFLYSYAPSTCWGSTEKYNRWIENGGLKWNLSMKS